MSQRGMRRGSSRGRFESQLPRRWTVRLAGAIPGIAILAVALPSPAGAQEPSFQDLAAECRASVGLPDGGRFCRSLEQLFLGLGSFCRQVPAPDPTLCAPFYGQVIASAEVDAYQSTWAHRALDLQRKLDDPLPLRDAFFPATHNSYNSSAYVPTLSGLDMNQHYSLYDQLRMDMRGLELDIHWFPSAAGDPDAQGRAPILCHGTGPHAGCTLERHVREGFAEIRAWLDLPGNEDEVVIVDLELHLDGETAAFDAAAQAIHDSGLAPLVFGPPDHGETCSDGVPLATSRSEVLAAGKHVILYGGCHGGSPAWDALVHSNSGRSQSGMPASFEPFPDCGRAGSDRHLWTRHWEDTTWLSAMAGASTAPIDAPTLRKLTDCTLNMPSLDKITPADDRLTELVWSWATGFPDDTPGSDCALANGDGRFENAPCAAPLRFACVDENGGWKVSAAEGVWSDGTEACAVDGATFAVPRHGYQARLLDEAAAGEPVWVNYAVAGGRWMPEP